MGRSVDVIQVDGVLVDVGTSEAARVDSPRRAVKKEGGWAWKDKCGGFGVNGPNGGFSAEGERLRASVCLCHQGSAARTRGCRLPTPNQPQFEIMCQCD